MCESRDRASAQDVPFYALVCTNREFHTRSPFTEDTLRLLPAPALLRAAIRRQAWPCRQTAHRQRGIGTRDAHDATPTTLSASTSSLRRQNALSRRKHARRLGVPASRRRSVAVLESDSPSPPPPPTPTDVTAPSTLSPPSTPVPMAPNLMVSTTDTLDGTSAEPASPASPLPVRPAKCHADDGANPEANTPPPPPPPATPPPSSATWPRRHTATRYL